MEPLAVPSHLVNSQTSHPVRSCWVHHKWLMVPESHWTHVGQEQGVAGTGSCGHRIYVLLPAVHGSAGGHWEGERDRLAHNRHSTPGHSSHSGVGSNHLGGSTRPHSVPIHEVVCGTIHHRDHGLHGIHHTGPCTGHGCLASPCSNCSRGHCKLLPDHIGTCRHYSSSHTSPSLERGSLPPSIGPLLWLCDVGVGAGVGAEDMLVLWCSGAGGGRGGSHHQGEVPG